MAGVAAVSVFVCDATACCAGAMLLLLLNDAGGDAADAMLFNGLGTYRLLWGVVRDDAVLPRCARGW